MTRTDLTKKLQSVTKTIKTKTALMAQTASTRGKELLQKFGPQAKEKVQSNWENYGRIPRLAVARIQRWVKEVREAGLKNTLQVYWQEAKVRFQPKVLLANTKKFLEESDPQATLASLSQSLSTFLRKKGTYVYGGAATLVLCIYFLSDITAIFVDEMIPEAPAFMPPRASSPKVKTLSHYSAIFERNLINSQGIIPGEEGADGNGAPNMDAAPVKTTLPFTLIGTLILEDELRSVATIEDKSAAAVFPVQVNDEIPSKARILSIEASKVIFLNVASKRKEYVELPLDPNAKNPKLTLGNDPNAFGIEKVAPTQYNVSRNEVDKALADFNNILTQARAVPNFENGTAAGYKLFQIVPGSIYDKLGLQNGDVIVGLNGSPINDPGKAFEMLNELKTSSHLELQVKKDGKQSTYSYEIH